MAHRPKVTVYYVFRVQVLQPFNDVINLRVKLILLSPEDVGENQQVQAFSSQMLFG